MPESDETPATPPIGYERAREELTEIVGQLEAGGVTLEGSLLLWERGEELAAICQLWLDGARQRLGQAAHVSGEDVTGR